MSLSRLPPSQQLLFPSLAAVLFAFLAFLALLAFAGRALAEDSVILNGGTVRTGQIAGMRNGSVILKLPEGEIGIPTAQIASVTMAAPKEITRGLNLQETGKTTEALAVLKPAVETFGGLPTDWAREATAALGDLYLSQDQPKLAAAAYTRFQQLYPAAGLSLQANVGLARVLFATNKIAEARAALTPLAAAALLKPDIGKAESAAYGQACFTLGNIAEKEGRLSEALRNYLLTVTVFYADRAITARAQERADALRKNGGVAVP